MAPVTPSRATSSTASNGSGVSSDLADARSEIRSWIETKQKLNGNRAARRGFEGGCIWFQVKSTRAVSWKLKIVAPIRCMSMRRINAGFQPTAWAKLAIVFAGPCSSPSSSPEQTATRYGLMSQILFAPDTVFLAFFRVN
jgi:hypothetical protein